MRQSGLDQILYTFCPTHLGIRDGRRPSATRKITCSLLLHSHGFDRAHVSTLQSRKNTRQTILRKLTYPSQFLVPFEDGEFLLERRKCLVTLLAEQIFQEKDFKPSRFKPSRFMPNKNAMPTGSARVCASKNHKFATTRSGLDRGRFTLIGSGTGAGVGDGALGAGA